jgi:predicted DNA-binding protein
LLATAAPPKPEATVSPSGAMVREGLTIRILAADSERLRALAYKTRQKKQALLDEAIRQYLDKMGV